MPIQKIPTVSRRVTPVMASAAVVLIGLAASVAAMLLRS